jgi:acetyl-CoA carboxylase carboxyl transferase subunit alpha
MTAKDLLEFGIIDGIVPEPGGGAQIDPEQAAEALRTTLRGALAELCGQDARRLIDDRYEKFRRMGALFTESA